MLRHCHMPLPHHADVETAERFPPPDDAEHRLVKAWWLGARVRAPALDRHNRSDPILGGQCSAIAACVDRTTLTWKRRSVSLHAAIPHTTWSELGDLVRANCGGCARRSGARRAAMHTWRALTHPATGFKPPSPGIFTLQLHCLNPLAAVSAARHSANARHCRQSLAVRRHSVLLRLW